MRLTMIPATFALLCACRMTLNVLARRSTPLSWFMAAVDGSRQVAQIAYEVNVVPTLVSLFSPDFQPAPLARAYEYQAPPAQPPRRGGRWRLCLPALPPLA